MMTKRRAVSAWFGFDLGRTTGKDGRRVKEEEEAEGWGRGKDGNPGNLE